VERIKKDYWRGCNKRNSKKSLMQIVSHTIYESKFMEGCGVKVKVHDVIAQYWQRYFIFSIAPCTIAITWIKKAGVGLTIRIGKLEIDLLHVTYHNEKAITANFRESQKPGK